MFDIDYFQPSLIFPLLLLIFTLNPQLFFNFILVLIHVIGKLGDYFLQFILIYILIH